MNGLRPAGLVALALSLSGCTLVGYPAGVPEAPPPAVVSPGTPGGERPGPAASPGREETASGTRPPADFRKDGPPTDPGEVDLDTIADAVPRDEPLATSGNMREYEVLGRVYRTLDTPDGYVEEGVASWYGREFQGRSTSSGEPYDMYAMTAAHRTLPLPSYVEITNLDNGKVVVVRVNDRGPFHKERLIDVSYAAAHRLGLIATGTARVRVRALRPEG